MGVRGAWGLSTCQERLSVPYKSDTLFTPPTCKSVQNEFLREFFYKRAENLILEEQKGERDSLPDVSSPRKDVLALAGEPGKM